MTPTPLPRRHRRRPTRLRMRTIAVAAAAAATMATSVPAAGPAAADTTATWPGAEQQFTNLLNRERVEHDLPTLRVNLQMVRIARDWSSRMAASSQLAHRPELSAVVSGPWQRIGENVGRGGWRSSEPIGDVVGRLHTAFMNSPGHRANILGDFTQIGIGVRAGEAGNLWVTVNFLKGPFGQFPLFEDIGANTHEANTERVWLQHIASGCSFSRYCPTAPVSRAQMATFLGRALGLTPVVSNRFVDVDPDNPHAGYINAVANAEIAAGCGGNRYCPQQPVTREQMATFLSRAMRLAPQSTPEFVDVAPTSTHFGYVNALANASVTAGCDGTGVRYCPAATVGRDQMSSFLSRAFQAPVSFWQLSPTDPNEAPGHSSDADVELGDPVVEERDPEGTD